MSHFFRDDFLLLTIIGIFLSKQHVQRQAIGFTQFTQCLHLYYCEHFKMSLGYPQIIFNSIMIVVQQNKDTSDNTLTEKKHFLHNPL